MMVFAKYGEMKDSGIKWIDRIPKDWTIKRLQYVVKDIISGPFGSSLKKESYVSKGFKIYGQEQVISGDMTFGDYYITKEKFDQMRRFRIQSNDILVSCVGTFGKILLVPKNIEDGVINPRLIKISISQNHILPEFLYVYLQSSVVFAQLDEFSRGGTMDIINSSILSGILILLPPITEQKQIVNFLNEKNKKIDNEISKNQKLIKLLQEQRQSTINHAVTKGLDDSVPMKYSGIEWIGEIPVHWNVKRLKYFVSFNSGYAFKSKDFIEDGIPLIKIGSLYQNKFDLTRSSSFLPNKFLTLHSDFKVKFGDLLISLTGTLGKRDYGTIIRYKENFPSLLNQRVGRIINVENKITDKFLEYSLISESFLLQLFRKSIGIRRGNLSNEDVLDPYICDLKISEQKQISNHLDKKIKKIDSLISKVQLQIKYIQEFRESLISSAVTGKICISN
jgi:type I restriction enzyme, S subunit